jgi:hypothetical protein
MSRKRSLKHRYFRFLRRIWPAPTLAAIILSLGACASRPMTSVSSQSSASAHTSSLSQTRTALPAVVGDDPLPYRWEPQLPTELHLAPEFQSACSPVVALPPSIVLDEKDEVLTALEPIASCLTLGPRSHQRLHLVGSSELPGRWAAPIDGSGRADRLRSSLHLLGVPFEQMVTHDVDYGNEVELGITSGSS